MAEFTLHFRLEDIITKLIEVHGYGQEKINTFKDNTCHRLRSPLSSFMGLGAYLYDPDSDSDIVLEDATQSAYVENLCQLAITLSDYVTELMATLNKDPFPENSAYVTAKLYCRKLERFV